MSMVCGLDLPSRPDHLRRLGGRVRRGVAGSYLVAGPGPVRSLASRRAGASSSGRTGGGGGGGLHRVAVCGGGGTTAGFEAHVAEPAETQAARGRKKRAKTDRSDARLQPRAAPEGRVARKLDPADRGAGVAGAHGVVQVAARSAAGVDQRIHAELFQHGVAVPEGEIRAEQTRAWLTRDTVQLSPAARQRISAGFHMIDATDAELVPLKKQLDRFGRRQPACQALARAHSGIGPNTSNWLWHLSASGCETGNWISAASTTRWTSRSRRWKREPRSGREAEEA